MHKEQQIIMNKLLLLLTLFPALAMGTFAQNLRITGSVADGQSGQSLPGAAKAPTDKGILNLRTWRPANTH